MRIILLVLSFSVVVVSAFSQAPYRYSHFSQNLELDAVPLEYKVPSLFVKDSAEWSDPKKAAVLALVLPGSGQLFNKRYLKAAIVYAGMGGLIYMFDYNRDSLSKYQEIYVSKIDGDDNTVDLAPERSESSIKSERDFHRRYRDISILGFVGLYTLQAIDANVDAHLKEFRVNKDLTMHVTPDIYRVSPQLGLYNGVSVSLRF